MNNDIEVLYTAEATVTGGREGPGRTSDGRLDVDFDVPSEMGGTGGPGTNPEQLFAAGFAACFQSSMLRYAFGRKLDLLFRERAQKPSSKYRIAGRLDGMLGRG